MDNNTPKSRNNTLEAMIPFVSISRFTEEFTAMEMGLFVELVLGTLVGFTSGSFDGA